MTNKNRKKLEQLGVSLYYCFYKVRPFQPNEILTDIKHFFHPLIIGEIAMLAFEDTKNERLFIYKTPRRWHHSFFKAYKVFSF